jgi:hypothetical protein
VKRNDEIAIPFARDEHVSTILASARRDGEAAQPHRIE